MPLNLSLEATQHWLASFLCKTLHHNRNENLSILVCHEWGIYTLYISCAELKGDAHMAIIDQGVHRCVGEGESVMGLGGTKGPF